jgi:hypothetical protein
MRGEDLLGLETAVSTYYIMLYHFKKTTKASGLIS